MSSASWFCGRGYLEDSPPSAPSNGASTASPSVVVWTMRRASSSDACLVHAFRAGSSPNSQDSHCLVFGALQIKYPENFFLLRGNHECASINRIYGFYDECKRRYNIRLWKTFTDCFNCLPVCALVDEKVTKTGSGRGTTRPRALQPKLFCCSPCWCCYFCCCCSH